MSVLRRACAVFIAGSILFLLPAAPASAAPPSNDDLAGAQALVGPSGTAAGSNVDATTQAGEPIHGGVGGGASVWYEWQAPESRHMTIETVGSDFDTVLAVYTGDTVDALTPVTADDNAGGDLTSRVGFDAVAGTTYRIVVDGKNNGGTPATGSVTLNWVQGPANDDQDDAEIITGTSGTTSGTNVGASTEEGDPTAATVWYQWVAPADAVLTVSVSSFNHVVDSSGTKETISLQGRRSTSWVLAGQSYDIVVGSSGSTGTFDLSWETTPAFENDNLADATELVGTEGTVNTTNVGATKQASQTFCTFTGVCTTRHEPGQGASIWFTWTPAADGRITFDTLGSAGDTGLKLFTTLPGCHCWSQLVEEKTSDSAAGTNDGRVSHDVTAGVVYTIFVHSTVSAWDDVVLNWTGNPDNDSFVDAEELVGDSGSTTALTTSATQETGEPEHAGVASDRSVWYEWTPSSDQSMTFDTSGSDFDTTLAIYTGSSVGSLTHVKSNDDLTMFGSAPQGRNTSRVRIDGTGGTTYHIAVDGFGDGGEAHLNWHSPPPANDHLAGAAPLSGADGMLDASTAGASFEPQEQIKAATIWYTWTAPETGRLSWDLSESDQTTKMAIYTGSAYPLTNVGDTVNGFTSSAIVTGGQTYKWVVYSVAGGPIHMDWTFDLPPDTTITSGPSGTETERDATFAFESNEEGSGFRCRLDRATASNCTSPRAFNNLFDGEHTVSIWAHDNQGNMEAEPATRTWTIDSSPDQWQEGLDGTFDGEGMAIVNLDDADFAAAYDVAVQDDGKVVVVGGRQFQDAEAFTIARLDPDGSLDDTFSGDGITDVSFDCPGCVSEPRALAHSVLVQDDGKIVVGGQALTHEDVQCQGESCFGMNPVRSFALARLESDGDLDATFGTGGRKTFQIGQTNDVTGLALSGTDIVVGGLADYDLTLSRLDADGSFDTAFSDDGKVRHQTFNQYDSAGDVIVQDDGKVIIAGALNQDVGALRYTAGGVLDPSFSGDGIATFPYTGGFGSETGTGAALQSDGKVIVGGYVNGGGKFMAVRFGAGGAVDLTFNPCATAGSSPCDGASTISLPGSTVEAHDVVVTGDDKIILGGYSGSPERFTLARLNADGTTDDGYSGDGKRDTAFPTGSAGRMYAMALRPNGQVVTAGMGFYLGFAVARYVSEADGEAPTDPSLSSSSHEIDAWSNDPTVDVSWSGASDAVSGVNGYSYAFDGSPSTVPDGTPEPAGTSATSPSLTDGNHYFHLRTRDGAGNWSGGAHLGPFKIDTVDPDAVEGLASSSHTASEWSSESTIDVQWSEGTDATSGIGGYSFVFNSSPDTVPDETQDAGALATSTSSAPRPDGTGHYFHIRAQDQAGNWGPASHLGPFWIDGSAPSGATIATRFPTFQKGKSFGVGWSAGDGGASGVETYDVRYRTASPGGSFGSLVVWRNDVTTETAKFSGTPGNTYCFSVTATDSLGTVSDPSAERCTAVPLDDRQMSRSGKWARKTGSGYYLNTYVRSTDKGATLSKSVKTKRITLVATKCRGCGTVGVYLGSKLLKKVSLGASRTKKRQFISVASFGGAKGGKLKIKVLTRRKPVLIEGVGLSSV